MNREERRELKKKGASEETIAKLEALRQPCTVGEAVQLARAASEDVCGEMLDIYKRDSSSLMMAMTLQIELLKDIVISSGLISQEEFDKRYTDSAKEFEEKQREYLKARVESENSKATSAGDMKVSDFEITKV